MNADLIFGVNNDRVNGDILIIDRGGDLYEANAAYTVQCPADFATSGDPGTFNHIQYTREQVTAFLTLNIHAINQAVPTINLNSAAELAYIRFLCVKYRLVSEQYDHNDYNVDYNQCVKLAGQHDTVAEILGNNNHGIPQAAKAGVQAAIVATLTNDNLRRLNTTFTNLVCLVAYMFRVRGHHYLSDMLPRYQHLWGKTTTAGRAFLNSWEHLATVGLHAVIPWILDDFWIKAVKDEKCDVILRLRINAAAAGTALIPVLDQGLKDVITVFPAISKIMPDEIQYISDRNDHLRNYRWDHSINARYYGANNERIDEKQTGAAGALIRAAITQLAPGTDLEGSKALQRAAKFAPITGAALGIALRNFVRSDKFLALQSQ